MFFCKSKHRWLCTQKVYKVRQTRLSQFVYISFVLREREKTKTKYSAPNSFGISEWAGVNPICSIDLPVQMSRSIWEKT